MGGPRRLGAALSPASASLWLGGHLWFRAALNLVTAWERRTFLYRHIHQVVILIYLSISSWMRVWENTLRLIMLQSLHIAEFSSVINSYRRTAGFPVNYHIYLLNIYTFEQKDWLWSAIWISRATLNCFPMIYPFRYARVLSAILQRFFATRRVQSELGYGHLFMCCPHIQWFRQHEPVRNVRVYQVVGCAGAGCVECGREGGSRLLWATPARTQCLATRLRRTNIFPPHRM